MVLDKTPNKNVAGISNTLWGVIVGSFVLFSILLLVYAFYKLDILYSLIGYYHWLPETQHGFNQFLDLVGYVGAFGALAALLLLTARWLRYGFQRSFFS